MLLWLVVGLPALACQQRNGAQTSPPTSDVAQAPSPAGQSLSPTPTQTEGPYYKAGSPQKASLRDPGMPGTPMALTGNVRNLGGQPVANAWLDFWQADAQGNYDNSGYRLRAHIFANESGNFTIETIIPGEYPGRTPHIHVKVRAGNGPTLTTQLYLPDAPGNQRDGIFNSAMVMKMHDAPDGRKLATYNFVLGS